MKLGEAIARADQMKPNGYTAEEKTRWLSELDGMLWYEALQWVTGVEPELPYDYDRDLERELDVYKSQLSSTAGKARVKAAGMAVPR